MKSGRMRGFLTESWYALSHALHWDRRPSLLLESLLNIWVGLVCEQVRQRLVSSISGTIPQRCHNPGHAPRFRSRSRIDERAAPVVGAALLAFRLRHTFVSSTRM